VVDLHHDSIAAHRSGMSDASRAGGVDLVAVSLDKIDARMKREAAEERIGPVAEGRTDGGVAGKGHAQGHERHQRLEALGSGDVVRDSGQRLVEGGVLRIDLGRDEGAADAAFAMRGNEFGRIEAGAGDDRGIARGRALRRAVDVGKRRHLASVRPVERTIDDGEARGGVEIVRGRGRARQRLPLLAGEGAQGVAWLIDRMRLNRARLDSEAGERRIGADRACVRAARRRGPEGVDRAERVRGEGKGC